MVSENDFNLEALVKQANPTPILLNDIDWAQEFLTNDFEYQLIAIRDLLDRNEARDQNLSKQIREAATKIQHRQNGSFEDNDVDRWVDLVHTSIFQDAAHSMAAVGMLAPFLESVFHTSFLKISERLRKTELATSNHPRWSDADRDAWDCHFVWNKGKRSRNIVKGICQMSQAVGLDRHLPGDYKEVLEALFGYRNKMFHNGFEWPNKEREHFENQIKNWPKEWFSCSRSEEKPWIFYMQQTFIQRLLEFSKEVFEALGSFNRALNEKET